jgi:EmrB/QacA subfamily drug resistance transporter
MVIKSDMRKWLVAGAVGVGLFAGALDNTVNVALPTITQSFNSDLASVSWIIVVFMTTSTSLSVGMGSAGDLFGLKRVFIFGLATYAIAMILMGFAPNLPVLVGLRVLQGIGTSAAGVTGPALVGLAFAAGQRGRGLGVVTSSQAVGGIAAGVVGGILVDAFGWPAIFWARVPVILAALVLAFVVLQGAPARAAAAVTRSTLRRERFDKVGATSLLLTVASLLIGLNLIRSQGWSSGLVIGLFIVATVASVVFVVTERRVTRPVIDLRLFRRLGFTSAFLTLLFSTLGTFLIWFIFPFYVADVLGESAKVLGLLLGLMAVCIALAAPVGGWLSDRVYPHKMVTVATVVLVLAMLWISRMGDRSSVVAIAIPLSLIGVGLGILRTSARTLVLSSVPEDRFGTALGALALGGSVGGVTSVALFSMLFSVRIDAHTLRLSSEGMTAAGLELQAFVAAFQDVFLVGAIMICLALVASLMAWRRGLEGK